MTGPRFRPDPDELAPRVITQDQVRTGAGTPAVARIVITNQAPEPRIMAVTALGLDAEWLPRPIRTRPVLPGESVPVDLWFSPATGTVPARYPLAIAVQALEPVHGQATSPTTIADVLLVVDAPGQIAIELDPADTTAVFGKRFTVVLRNTGSTPASVRLDAQTPLSTNVRVPDDEVVVGPGQTVRLRGRVRVHRPQLLGHRSRHTYTVSARSSAAPRHAEGSLTARALFGPGGTKVVALLAVVGVWLALAVVFIPKLANNARNRTIAGQGVATAPASPGSSAGAGGAGASAGTGGATGSGAGSKSGPGGAGNSPSGASPAAVQLNGSVTGNSPAGVTVAMAPTSLVDEQVAGATPVGLSTESLQSVREIGKVPSSAVLLTQPGTVSASRSTVTGADGAWSFAQVRAPGYYLVTFSKPGYQTQRYVIDAANAVATQPLKVALVAGQGRLSGAVNGPSGPVGGAQITITDGTNTITTSSTSTGTIGQWSVDGLSTPSSYLITAGKGGLSTESQLITLDAGATASVTLRLQTGVVSLVGTVRGVDGLGALVGLGDAQVTVTDGTITRTASTITQGPVGNYTLPDLPPGQYTITIEFPGYQAQTQRVKLTAGESKVTVSAVLTSASSVVAGQVTGDVLDSNGNATGATVAKVGAGLTLASPTNTYKITSTSNGSFRFSGVTPGTYVLSAEYAGLRTGFATVKAVAGSSATASFDLKVQTVTNNATIAGFVGSATNPSGTIVCQTPAPTNCITFMLVDSAGHAVPISPADQPPSASGPTGYTLAALASTGLAPGLYHLTIGAVGYLPASVSVEVPLDGVARAPQVSLYPANTISGAVSALGNLATDGPQPPYTNCVWAIPDGVNAPAPTNCQPPTASTCTQTGRADVAFTTISATDNTYSLDGLCDGTYRVYIVVTNPFYVSPAPVATETVSHGQTANYSPHVFRKGRVVLTIFQLDQTTGALTPAADGSLTGTASCTGSPAADLSTMAGGKVVVAGVNAGTVACSAATTNPTRSGVVHAVAVGNDQDSASSLTLVAALGPATGRVVSTWGTGVQAVGGAVVTIRGIIGYDGTNPSSGSVTVNTDSNGCFALTADGAAPPASTGVCSGVTAPNTGRLALVSGAVTVSVQPPAGYRLVSNANVTLSGANTAQVALVPVPVSFSGTVTTSAGGDLASVNIQVTGKPAGSGAVRVTADGSGTLTWTDPNIGSPNQAWPGSYTIVATLPGYAPATAAVTCDFNTAACTIGTLTLQQLGGLTGTVNGVLGTALTDPAHALGGATLSATCAHAGCSTAIGPTTFTATADASGSYTFGGGASPFVLQTGDWSVTVSAFGYTPVTQTVTVASGANTFDPSLLVKLTVLKIGVQTPSGALFTAASLTLTRVDTGATFTPDAAGNPDGSSHYVFSNLVPTSYLISVSGSGIVPTFLELSLPLLGTSPPVPVQLPVSVVTNTVSGTVVGQQGKSTATSGLNNATVSLGHLDAQSVFQIDNGTDGHPLTATTHSAAGVDGGYSFTTVPNGTYLAQYSAAGYVTQVGSQAAVVNGGQSASLPTANLVRVTHDVVLTVTTSATGDVLTGVTPTLTAGSDSTWILSSQPATVNGKDYSWTFNAVPSGAWSIALALPAEHFGTLTSIGSAPTLTCTTSSPLSCTSAALTVAATGNPNTPVAVGYNLAEYALALTVTATPLTTDVAPGTVTLTVAGTSYSNNAFPVGSAATPVWVAPGTHNVTADANLAGWPSVTQAFTAATASNPIALQEIGATVTVHVKQGGAALPAGTTASVTLTAPTGSSITWLGTAVVTNASGDAVFMLVPFGTGWTASAVIGASSNTGTFNVQSQTPPTVNINVP